MSADYERLNTTMTTTEGVALATALRAWSAHRDSHEQAAVWLLIEHGHWLHTTRFARFAVAGARSRQPRISWSDARAAFDAGEFDRSSTSERAILDFAIALGQDRYKISPMGSATGGLLVKALTHAAS